MTSPSMLAELAERDAAGEIAAIYDEIRRFWAVPYVSSMQRHLATRPGWLPWVWAALRPAFASGRAQTAAWRLVEDMELTPLPPISRDALSVWGVDAGGETAIRTACESFVRVSPVNLVLSGLLRRLLRGERPGGDGAYMADRTPLSGERSGASGGDAPRSPAMPPGGDAVTPPRGARPAVSGEHAWTPPDPLAALPAMVDIGALPPDQRAVLTSLGTMVGGQAFVPGLYRMLARWPGFIAHVATVLSPRLKDAATRDAGQRVLDAIDAEVPAVFAMLPVLPEGPQMPAASEFEGVLTALDAYRKTSPEMILASLMIRNALPRAESTAARGGERSPRRP